MLASSLAGAFRWWCDELRGMLPATIGRLPRHRRRIVLTPDGLQVSAIVEDDAQVRPVTTLTREDGVLVGELANVLRQLPQELRSLPVVVRVMGGDCHCRVAEMPVRARRDFDKLLLLDLERSTPLKAIEVFHAYEVIGPGRNGDLLSVRHHLIKQRRLAPLIDQVSSADMKLEAVERWSEDARLALPLGFLAGGSGVARPAARPVAVALPIVVLALAAAGLVIHWVRQEEAWKAVSRLAESLEIDADEGRRATARASATIAELDRVRGLFDRRVPVVLVLEEVTRLIPDDAWVEELRIEGDVVEITGLARAGAKLLTAFETSRFFHETQFTAPLRLDSNEDRERFGLRTRLRAGSGSASGQRGVGP